MTERKERIPDAQLRLPDGTHLNLYRNVRITRDEGKTEIIGDWLVALPPHEPRGVGFFYKKDGRQMVEIIYDKHTMKYGERTDIPLPEKIKYVFCTSTTRQKRLSISGGTRRSRSLNPEMSEADKGSSAAY